MKIKKIENEKLNKIVIINVVIAALVLTVGITFIYKPFSDKSKSMRVDILKERDKNLLIGKIKALSK